MNYYKTNTHQKEQGFTLVELAIVMIIIGLLIGGVLKGQQLIENAKVNSAISTLKGFHAAQIMFRDTYGGLPGDLTSAESRLKGCTPANDCAPGNGNSIVGREFTDFGPGGTIPDFNTGGVGSPNQENTQYWKHLALAGLITGVNSGADTSDPVLGPTWGETNPASSVSGGGYTIAYWNYTEGASTNLIIVNGHAFFLTREVDGFAATTKGLGVVTPKGAARIDRKLDDGLPYSGDIWGMNWSSECVILGTSSWQGTTYNETQSGRNCALWYFVD